MWFVFASASAQTFTDAASPDLSAQTFRPTVTGSHLLWVDEVGATSDPNFRADALFHYTNDPLVYEGVDGTETRLVSDVLQADLMGAASFGPAQLGLVVPIYVFQAGIEERAPALGDLAIDGRLALRRGSSPVGVSLGGRLWIPTSTAANALALGEGAYELSVAVDGAAGPVLLAANLGTRGGPRNELEDIVLDDGFLARAGAVYAFDERTGAGLETNLSLPYSAPLSASGATDWEWLATGYRSFGDWRLRGGVGTGLTHGVGSPDFRLLVGLGWTLPQAEPAPEPVPVVVPAPPPEPVVVDTDGDGWLDPDDPCPTEPEDLDGVRDDDGCPEPEVAVRLRVVDPGGNILDTARSRIVGIDGVGAGERRVELIPGTYRVEGSAPGYEAAALEVAIAEPGGEIDLVLQPASNAKVVVTRERIDLRESVLFQTASARILPASDDLLGQVAQVLHDYPEIELLRIEGHTDSRGDAAYNLKLSQDRAASVRQWLIDHGIAAERLESEGFGETRPLDPAQTAEAWAKNRRVDMTIARWVEEPVEP